MEALEVEVAKEKAMTQKVVVKLKYVLATYRQLQAKYADLESSAGAKHDAAVPDVAMLTAELDASEARGAALEAQLADAGGAGALKKEQKEKAALLAKLKQIVPKFRAQQTALRAAEARAAADSERLVTLASVRTRVALLEEQNSALEERLLERKSAAASAAPGAAAAERVAELERALDAGKAVASEEARAATKAKRKAEAAARVAERALKKKTAEADKFEQQLQVAAAALEVHRVDAARAAEELAECRAAAAEEEGAGEAQRARALSACQAEAANMRSVVEAERDALRSELAAARGAAAHRATTASDEIAALRSEMTRSTREADAGRDKAVLRLEAALGDYESMKDAKEALSVERDTLRRELAAARDSAGEADDVAALRATHAAEIERRDAVREKRKDQRKAAQAADAAGRAAEVERQEVQHATTLRSIRAAHDAALDELKLAAAESDRNAEKVKRALEVRVESLRGESNGASAVVAAAKEEHASALVTAERTLADATARAALLTSECAALRETGAAAVARSAKDAEKLRATTDAMLEERTLATESNARHTAAALALEEEAARLRAALSDCRDDAAALRTQVAAARTPPPPPSPSPVDAVDDGGDSAAAQADAETEIAELGARVTQLSAERAQLLEKLHAIVARFRAQQEQLAESKVRLAQADVDREALASARVELAAMQSAAPAAAAAPGAAAQAAEHRVITLENEKAQLVAKMKKMLLKYRQMQEDRRKEKEVTAVQIKTVTDQVRRELEGIEAARDSSSGEAGRLRQQLDLLGARCMALESEVDMERKAHAPLRATVEQLRTEHAAALNEAADASSVAQRGMSAYREKVQLETMQSLQVMEREHRRRLASSERRREEAVARLETRELAARNDGDAAERALSEATARCSTLSVAAETAAAEILAMRARDAELSAGAARADAALTQLRVEEERGAALQSEVKLLRTNIKEVAHAHREELRALREASATASAQLQSQTGGSAHEELELLRVRTKQLEQALRDVRKREGERSRNGRSGAADGGTGELLQETRRKLAAAEAQQDALARQNDALKSGATVSRAMQAVAVLQKQVELLKAQGVQTPVSARERSSSGEWLAPTTPQTPVSSMASLTSLTPVVAAPVPAWTGGGTPLPSAGVSMGPPRSRRGGRRPSLTRGSSSADDPRALREANNRCSDMQTRIDLLEASVRAARVSGGSGELAADQSEGAALASPASELRVARAQLKSMQRLLNAAQRRLADRAAFGAEVLALRASLREASTRNKQGKLQIAQLAALVAGGARRGGRRQAPAPGASGERLMKVQSKLDDAVLTLSLLRSEAKGKDALAASLRKECDELRGVIDDHESKLEALEATLELESAECKRLVASLAAVGGAGGSGTPATRERAQVQLEALRQGHLGEVTTLQERFAAMLRKCNATEAQLMDEIKEITHENEAGKALIAQLIARLSSAR